MFSETVSVIVPVYNSEQSLGRCLQSALSQSYENLEVLVYDDASTDRSLEIMEVFERADSRLKVYRGQRNAGAGVARDYLLKEARGDYFAFLDSDDEWRPEKIARQISVMNEKNFDICFCSYEIFNEDQEHLGVRRVPNSTGFVRMHLSNWIPTSMAVVRAGLKGVRDMPAIRRRQDYGYWLRLFQENRQIRACGIDEILGRYYRGRTGLSSSVGGNIVSNFAMFNEFMGYNKPLSSFLVLTNAAVRVFRR